MIVSLTVWNGRDLEAGSPAEGYLNFADKLNAASVGEFGTRHFS
jgi:hypothetical protein